MFIDETSQLARIVRGLHFGSRQYSWAGGSKDDSALSEVAIAKMEGYTNDEIADRLGVKTRTIERKLRIIREIWSAHSD